MASWAYLRRTPDVYHVGLTYEPQGLEGGEQRARIALDWTSADELEDVLRALREAKDAEPNCQPRDQWVRLDLGVVEAAGAVAVALHVEMRRVVLREMELSRQLGSGYGVGSQNSSIPLVLAKCGELEQVRTLRVGDGFLHLISDSAVRWRSLTTLHLTSIGLSTLPTAVGGLTTLEALHLDQNKLSALPPIGTLVRLRVLTADHNQLTSVPPDLKQCSELRVLSLEFNRLSRPLLNMHTLTNLHTLLLFANPIEHLPEMLHCKHLRRLSLVNIRIVADPTLSSVEAEIGDLGSGSLLGFKGGGGGANPLLPFFSLIFRHSSCQHPLIASAIARLADNRLGCDAILAVEGSVQQLLSMVLADSMQVVNEACTTLSALAQDASAAGRLLSAKALQRMLGLMQGNDTRAQTCALRVIAALAQSSDTVALQLTGPDLLERLRDLFSVADADVRMHALVALGNLACAAETRRAILATEGIRPLLASLALASGGNIPARVRRAATRALAALGENDLVSEAVGRPPISDRGVRVLSMDGGGMRGLATIQMLRRIEAGTGRRIHELFDLICGTSTGGVLATAIGVMGMTLDECEVLYHELGRRTFAKHMASNKEEQGWRDQVNNWYSNNTQRVRVAVTGCKHDVTEFEAILREQCLLDGKEVSLIDSAVANRPKVAVLATLVTIVPAEPYVFRNYQYPPSTAAMGNPLIKPPLGSCRHHVWQGVRASSAAPYYLADFTVGTETWHDGAVTVNNPAISAFTEAQLLWPGKQVELMVSIGSGACPPKSRELSTMSKYIDAGAVVLESACAIDRVVDACATLLPLVPGLSYRRINVVDDRCNLDLDEIDPHLLQGLVEATDEYIRRDDALFTEVCAELSSGLEPPAVGGGGDPFVGGSPAPKARGAALERRRAVLILEVPRSPHVTKAMRPADAAEAACQAHGVACARSNLTAVADAPTALMERLRALAPRVGVVHLSAHGGDGGLVLGWRSDVRAVAEPGADAVSFLAGVDGPPHGHGSVEALCQHRPRVQVGGVLHSRIASHAQATASGGNIRTVVFERTLPKAWLSPDMAREAVGLWSGLVVVVAYRAPPQLVAAILDGGAKAVVAPACGEPDAGPATAPEVSARAFHDTFYGSLCVGGADARDALAAAVSAAPEYACFRCYAYRGGVLVAYPDGAPLLPAGGPEPPPSPAPAPPPPSPKFTRGDEYS